MAGGRYQGVSEVVREGLRLLEDQEARRLRALEAIDQMVREGMESGSGGELDLDAAVAQAARAERLLDYGRRLRRFRSGGSSDTSDLYDTDLGLPR